MPLLTEKKVLSEKTLKALRLDAAGYTYNFDRLMYINRHAKKAFSFEFIDDNPESVIGAKINEPKSDDEWRFYTNLPMSEGTEKELKSVLK